MTVIWTTILIAALNGKSNDAVNFDALIEISLSVNGNSARSVIALHINQRQLAHWRSDLIGRHNCIDTVPGGKATWRCAKLFRRLPIGKAAYRAAFAPFGLTAWRNSCQTGRS